MARVSLLLVSHSAAAAQGTAEIARQMAPDVEILAAGGTEDGIGTSVDRVMEGLERLGSGLVTTGWETLREGAGIVVLTDLGSAVLTTESVLEMVDEELAALVRVPSAPFVEGAVTAAVEAQQGGDLDEVAAAAVRAGTMFGLDPAGEPAVAASVDGQPSDGGDLTTATATVTVADPQGLHARPAAVLASTVAELGVPVRIDGADGRSILELLQLGVVGGQQLTVTATGAGAQHAVDTVAALIAGPGDESAPPGPVGEVQGAGSLDR